jgi:hypothetical protein
MASNAVVHDAATAGDVLTGATTRILTGTLATGLGTLPPGDPIPGETFAVSDTASYRYLELHVTSAADWAGTHSSALNEVRVFGNASSVPEPASFGLAGLAISACLYAARRRAR